MFADLCQVEQLCRAWRRVRANGAATGGDGEDAARFAASLDTRLADIAAALSRGRYRPGPLRRVEMRRPDGKLRVLRIPGLADRVVQTAAQALLSGHLDRRQSAASFGYRPARSVAQALDRLRQLAPRHAHVLDADIRRFFDEVPHGPLIDDLGLWIEDARMVALIGQWLDGWGGGRGLAQGSPIAPLLANLYLHPLDMAIARGGFAHIRYADDFVVLARDLRHAQAAERLVAGVLARRGLALSAEKTRILPLSAGLRFLGADLVFNQKGG